RAVVNRWRYEGQVTDIPRTMHYTNEEWVNNERFSDRWIEDGSYLKLKKVRLTWQTPISLSWLQGLTIWGEANNVFTLTKYLGTDPEVTAGNGVLYQGIDAGRLAAGRSFNFGVTINL
ncbi:MAG: SusC/RagA family TonB-linked outer membrane protein, partial [Bacteroidaceae bacterium]|nr:SusC/RagA family TonB-linked outer membrane protein [Bacteroidaceae bacterium]